MVTPELIAYVKRQVADGLSPENIEAILTRNGWRREEVEEVLNAIQHPATPAYSADQPPMPGRAVEIKEKKFWTERKLVLTAWAAGAAVLVGGYSAYAYYRELPSVVLPKTADALVGVRSLHYTARASLEVKNLSSSTLNAFVPLNGSQNISYDFSLDSQTDFQNGKGDTTVGFSVKGAAGGTGSPLRISLETRSVEGVAYVELLDAPDFGGIDTSFFKNTWIKIDPARLREQMEALGVAPTSTAASSTPQFQLKSEELQTMRDIARKYEFFDSVRKEPNDSVDGVPVYHYAFTVNLGNVEAYLEEVARTVPGFPATPSYVERLKNSFGAAESPTGEIWVATDTKLPKKLSLSFTLSDAAAQVFTSGSILLHAESFNEPVQVYAPADAVDILEVLTKFLHSTSTSASGKFPSAGTPHIVYNESCGGPAY